MTIRRKHVFDHSTKTHTELIRADVEHVTEDNLDHRNAGNNGFSKDRTFRKIGSIPMICLNEAFKEGINPLDGSEEATKWIKKYLAQNPKFMTVDKMRTNKVGIIK